MDKYIGRLLDNRYEILEVIGTGGMAVVYKARCHRLNRLVAIKILKDDFMEDEEFRRRFHSESQAVAMFSHPNIVSVYDVSTSITADYIVMELIDGITLKQYMEKKGVLNWKETLHFAIQIAKALEHAHSRGIVHRDIKPHNVMVLKNGSVKVTDFGIARMMSQGNTLTREALGSVHYISPEQAKGGRVDNRSDIYSLGVVMYEMMSGRPPYDGESPVAVAIQHINGGAKMPSTLNPNIPGGMEQIIMKAMAHEPDGRYATATAMLTDLDEFRKNPSILFDYNTPPTDAVVNIPKAPLVFEPQAPKTTAQRVESRTTNTTTNRRPPENRTSPATASAAELQRRREERQQAARRRQEAEAEQRRNRITTIAVIACSLAMVVAVVFFLIVLLKDPVDENLVQAPKLTGQVYEVVKDSSELKEFTLDVTYEYNNDYPEGTIISQSPKAGEEMAADGKIKLVISKGVQTEPEYMPDVTNMTEEEAKQILDEIPLNLKVIPVEKPSEDVAVGLVISSDPAETAELTENQKVILYISSGKEIKKDTMPRVFEEDEETAKLILNNKELELEIKVEKEFSAEVEKGLVIRSDPEEGKSLQTGQTVTLYISEGPQLQKIPEGIFGMEKSDALVVMLESGFKAKVVESEDLWLDAEPGTIVQILETTGETSAEKLEGDEVAVDNTIVLVYAREPQPETKTVKIPVSLPKAPEPATNTRTNDETTTAPETEQETQTETETTPDTETETTPEPEPEPEPFEVTIEVTRDGTKVDGKLSDDEKYYVLENQSGIGDVIYVVTIKVNGEKHEQYEHKEHFEAQ